MQVFKVKVNAETSEFIPVRAHPSDAGTDLKSKEFYTLLPGEQHMYDTGVAIAIESLSAAATGMLRKSSTVGGLQYCPGRS